MDTRSPGDNSPDQHSRHRFSPLTEVAIRAAKPREKAYKLKDTDGLYLLVRPSGRRLWRLRFTHEGRESMVSFGHYPAVTLKEARERRDDCRRLLAKGRSPAAARRAERKARADTFESISREWLELQRSKMSKATFTKSQWLLEDLLFPYIGKKPISSIQAPDLLDALRHTEERGRNESAHRAKQKAGQIFRYAIATGRARHDPAGSLKGALAPVASRNRAAITDPQQIGQLLRALDGYRGQPGTEIALKLAPLVFVRPGELRQAQWEEFALEGDEPLWRIPAERTKMRVEHLVPLSRQAVELLRRLEPITGPQGYLLALASPSVNPVAEPADCA